MGFRSQFEVDQIPVDVLLDVDRLANEFENAKLAGRSLRTEDLVAKVPPDYRRFALAELLAIEFEALLAGGQQVLLPEFIARFPSERTLVESVYMTVKNRSRTESSVPVEATDEPANRSSAAGINPTVDSNEIRHFRIIKKLGEGGMGTVYLAVNTNIEKLVALKLLRADRYHDSQYISRFKLEAIATGKLEHPNIVQALDAGEVDGTHFLVMEYVDGIDLAKLLRLVGSLELVDACEIIRQTSEALSYAHHAGLVHRDIKPSNLMLTSRGGVKLLDLGLALLEHPLRDGEQLTREGQMLGTLNYMAPEQLYDSKSVDPRSDIYGLGLVFLELIAGSLPPRAFQDDKEIARFLATQHQLPGPIRDLLQKMLARNPDKRPGDAKEVAEALEKWLIGSDLTELYLKCKDLEHRKVSRGSTAPEHLLPLSEAVSHSNAPSSWHPAWLISAVAISLAAVAIVLAILVLLRDDPPPPVALPASTGTVRIKNLPTDFDTGDIRLRATNGSASYDLSSGDTEIPPGQYRIETAPAIRLDLSILELEAGETLVLAVGPASQSLEADFPHQLPDLPREPGAFTRYGGVVTYTADDREISVSPEIILRCLGEMAYEDKPLTWLEIELVFDEHRELAVLGIDRMLYEREFRLSVEAGWVWIHLQEHHEKLKSTIGDRLVLPFDANRDLIRRRFEEWGYLLPEDRLSVHDFLVLFFDGHVPGASQPIRDLRDAINAAGNRVVSVSHGDTGRTEPSRLAVVEGQSDNGKFSYRLSRDEEKKIPFGFFQARIHSPTAEVELNYRNHRASGDQAPDLAEKVEMLVAAAERYQAVTPPPLSDFTKPTLPATAGSYSVLYGALTRAGGREVTFELELQSLGGINIEGTPYHWIQIRMSSSEMGEVEELYWLLIDETAYRTRQEFNIYRGWYVDEDLCIDMELPLELRQQVLDWFERPSHVAPISIEEVLVLLFDARGFRSETRFEQTRELVAKVLVRRNIKRKPRYDEVDLVSGPSVKAITWSLQPPTDDGMPESPPEPAMLDATYEISRSEQVPFDFARVHLKIERAFELNTGVRSYGINKEAAAPKLEEVMRLAAQTMDELAKRRVLLWAGRDHEVYGFRQLDTYGYDDAKGQFQVVIQDHDGTRSCLAIDELCDANRKLLVEREATVWDLVGSREVERGLPVGWSSPHIALLDSELRTLYLRRYESSATDAGPMLSEDAWKNMRRILESNIEAGQDAKPYKLESDVFERLLEMW